MTCFATFTLTPLSPLHLGSRRAGIVAMTHRYVPGHLFTYALAAQLGRQRGKKREAFTAEIDEIARRFRFGPAFFLAPNGERLSDDEVEARLIRSFHHVTLHPQERAAIDRALFELEAITPQPSIVLAGGVWIDGDPELDGIPLRAWLDRIRLGGERKAGYGVVRCTGWEAHADEYPGIGPANAHGLHLPAGATLPGPACDDTILSEAPLLPWLGRRYSPTHGHGRELSPPALVRIHATLTENATFLPANTEPLLGCWQRQHAPS